MMFHRNDKNRSCKMRKGSCAPLYEKMDNSHLLYQITAILLLLLS